MAVTTRKNIQACYPELDAKQQSRLAKASLQETFISICETGASWMWSPDRLLSMILETEGLELMAKAHDEGRGVVVIVPHLGNWELLGLYFSKIGQRHCHQLFQPPANPELADLIFKARSRTGAIMVPTDTKGVIKVLKALKNGDVVGILPDQVPPESGGEFAPFFGRQALTMTLVSRLVHKTGAQALVATAARIKKDGKAGYRVHLIPADEKIYARHMNESLEGLNHSIENMIALYPEQYQWEYKRFKRVPEGVERIY